MPELSLTQLSEDRPSVSIRAVTYRTLRPRTSDDVFKGLGLQDLRADGGVVYGLPARVVEGQTLLYVRLSPRVVPKDNEGQPSEFDDWILTWEQLTKHGKETVPPEVVAESAAFGGSAGLEELVRKHWDSYQLDDDDESRPSIITVQYALTGWRSKLLPSKPKKIGQLKVTQSGSYWDIADADVLIGVALNDTREELLTLRDGETMLTAIAKLDSGSLLDAAAFEKKVWQDLLHLVEVPT